MSTKASNLPQEENNDLVTPTTPAKKKPRSKAKSKTIAQSNVGEQNPQIQSTPPVEDSSPTEETGASVNTNASSETNVDVVAPPVEEQDIPNFVPQPAKPVTFGYFASHFFKNADKSQNTMIANNNPLDFLILIVSYVLLIGIYTPVAMYKGLDSFLVALLKMETSFSYYYSDMKTSLMMPYGPSFVTGLLCALVVVALLSLAWMLFGYKVNNRGGYLNALAGVAVSLWPSILCLVIAIATSFISFGIGFLFFVTSFLILILSSYPRLAKYSGRNGMSFSSLYAICYAVILCLAVVLFSALLEMSLANSLEQLLYSIY